MLVIPAINCKNFKCVKERLEQAAEFLPKAQSKRWVQIDISDGKFTKAKSWNNPKQLQELRSKNYELRNINIETHLMVSGLRANLKKWVKVSDRVIFHFEKIDEIEFGFVKRLMKDHNMPGFGIAITPQTPVEIIVPFLGKRGMAWKGKQKVTRNNAEFKINFVQLLAVEPGFSGQRFDKLTINKIKFLKKNHPKITIEIDGGMDPKTAKLVKKAGANIINSGSYIFDSKNPEGAYKKLSEA